MPELPEVETIVRELNESGLIGAVIREAVVFWPRTIATPALDDFHARIAHQTIIAISRRGKFIVFSLERGTLLVHLRMTGKMLIDKKVQSASPHERVRIRLDDGRVLRFEDQRKFGKWYLLAQPEAKFSELGLEPLSKSFTATAFKNMVGKSSQQIKPFLLNQHHIAGLGNIYADEALWEAKVHPMRKANSLTSKEVAALFRAIPKVLLQGIAHNGTTLGNTNANYFSVSGRRGGHQTQLNVFRRDGLPCPRCGTDIIKITVSQRGTHLCPTCQVSKDR